ncbi:hypothetical protein SAMN05421786_102234 [Chryseobacterium ureilyticum]|uniref:Uncharacterized protein n=1 Tax=Chryseobacterium ureilyticum TaxID=373668 RepID=A0A1N7M3R3_9FLAO|nr:hypothetical protein SAMN05421786_102234 [Chryseobacterium ureilyticum]
MPDLFAWKLEDGSEEYITRSITQLLLIHTLTSK